MDSLGVAPAGQRRQGRRWFYMLDHPLAQALVRPGRWPVGHLAVGPESALGGRLEEYNLHGAKLCPTICAHMERH